MYYIIYYYNVYRNEITNEYRDITHNELQIFEYYNNIDTNEKLNDNTYTYLKFEERKRWIYILTKNICLPLEEDSEEFVDIQQFFDSNKKFCIIFKRENREIYDNIENIEGFKILFKNADGVLIEKID